MQGLSGFRSLGSQVGIDGGLDKRGNLGLLWERVLWRVFGFVDGFEYGSERVRFYADFQVFVWSNQVLSLSEMWVIGNKLGREEGINDFEMDCLI